MQSLTIETPDGIGEATKEGQDRPWEVNLPSTSFKFYGPVSQVKAEIKKALKMLEQEELLNTQPRANGKLGGSPAIDIESMLALIEEEGDLCRADYYRRQYPREWRKARRLDRLNTWRDDTGIEYVEVGRQQ